MAHYYDRETGAMSETPKPGWLTSASTILKMTRPYETEQALASWYAADIFNATQANQKACDRGNQIDAWAKAYLQNLTLPLVHLDWTKLRWQLQPYLDQLKARGEIVAIDRPVFHEFYAGTPDLVMKLPEAEGLTIIDFKTRSRPMLQPVLHEAFVQCTAYASAYSYQHLVPVTQVIVAVIQPTYFKVYPAPAALYLPHWQTRLNGYLQSQAQYQS
jgi:hypothetical protein